MRDSGDFEDYPSSGGGGGTLTYFPSPFSSSSSSSEFEFSITLSPSSNHSAVQPCPADELFYKGQLLPLHLSPRLSLVRTLLLSSSSTSSSDATSTTASRDSNGSSSSGDSHVLLLPASDSSRKSSVTEEDYSAAKRRYFSSFTARFSSFFLNRGNKKIPTLTANLNTSPSSNKPTTYSSSAKKTIKKYVEKVKPLYEKLSSLHHKPSHQQKMKTFSLCRTGGRTEMLSSSHTHSHSFTGNQRSPYRTKSAASCPSSMRSSPSHSGLLASELLSVPTSSSSSMDELQCAIEAAIAHCKSTMAKQKKTTAPVSSIKDDLCPF